MSDIIYSFILTGFAGLSTMIGFLFVYVKGNKNKIIAFSLAFASGVMCIISFIDLIPSSFDYLNDYYYIFRILLVVLCIVIGMCISSLFDRYMPINYESSKLYKIGILTLISIMIHNIPEGIITFMVSQIDKKMGLSLAIAISLHNIPEGISISVPLYYATNNKPKTLLVVFLAGFSEMFGGIITWLLLSRFITNNFLGISFGIIAGIMLYISLFNLMKEGYKYNNRIFVLGLIMGVLLMIISHFTL